ncbi:MAG: dockerin type I domain-containing protein [Bacteroidota bacterium]
MIKRFTPVFFTQITLAFLLTFPALPTSAQTLTERITQLTTVVSSFPDSTSAQQAKKAILEIALERAGNAIAVSYDQEAEDLILDVIGALDQPAEKFIERNPEASNLNGFGPILNPENNPYLEGLVNSATNAIASPDKVFPRTTPDQAVYNGLGGTYGVRSAPSLSRNYFWLFAHEQSPMRFQPELIKRVLRRMHAFADLVNLDPFGRLGAPFNAWYDQFAIEYAFPAFYEIAELHPHLLLPSQKKSWDNMMHAARNRLAKGNGNIWRGPWNYNIETARHLGILNIGLYLDDQEIVDRVLRHADACMRMQRLDGAMPYHGDDRPSVNYHNVVYGLWLQMYEQTGYEPLREAIERSQWKGPTTGRTEEWWTSPWDKAFRWNIQKGVEAGVEAVATLSENPYVRGQIDRNQQLTGAVSGRTGGKDAIVWYNPNISSFPLPDNYTIPDRNIGGPRAWYGDFTYAGSFRPWQEGHKTLMGAMTVDTEDGQLNSILAEVTPKVWITPEGEEGYTALAHLTNKEVSATTISKDYSVGTTLHGLKRSKGAYAGPLSEWLGRQVWVGLPDRIIGLVSIVPGVDNAKGYAVHGVLRLISGGTTGAKTLKELETISPTHYRYGTLDIIIHEQTYSSVTGILKPYRLAKFPATELTFSDRETEPAEAGTEKTYPLNSDYRFVVEVRPAWAAENELTSVSVLGDQQMIGLEAVGATRSLQVWLNTTEEDLEVDIQRNRLPEGKTSFVKSDGLLGRAGFKADIPEQTSLTGGQHAVLIVSEQTEDHTVGWTSFSGMVGFSEIEVMGEKNFGRVAPGSNKEITYKITNPNEALLTLTGTPVIEIEGDDAFSLVNAPELVNITYGDTTTFTLRFAPTAEASFAATLKIRTNVEGNEVYECRLTGLGSEEILLLRDSPFGSSWGRADVWEDSLAASVGKKYRVDRSKGGATLRTPTSKNPVFPGEYLKVVDGGVILLKTAADGVIDIPKTIFSGGGLAFGNGAVSYTWKGEVEVLENGFGIGNGGSILFEGELTGNGPVNIGAPLITFSSGSWNGDLSQNAGELRFGFDITDGAGFIYNGGIFDINGQNHLFKNLFIGGNQMPAGVYTATDLGEGFVGEGTITIKPYTTVPDNLAPPKPEEVLVENTLKKCNDGIDNDGDGLIDCNDPDCQMLNPVSGATCDDGDSCTINDVFNADCECVGTYLDEDNDGICAAEDCDDNDDGIRNRQMAGTVCDDGDPATVNDVILEDGCTCEGGLTKTLSIRLFLEGPYEETVGLMSDSLRQKNLFSMEDPYGLGETANPILLKVAGEDAIVDWIKVEVRDKVDPSIIHASEAMLFQRDGALITSDGDSLLTIGVSLDSAYVTVSHTNHLALTTGTPVGLTDTLKLDFSRPETAVFGGDQSGKIVGDKRLMIAGDANGDGKIDEIDKIQLWRTQNGTSVNESSRAADFNLDGVINVLDKNEYWRVNNGAVENTP